MNLYFSILSSLSSKKSKPFIVDGDLSESPPLIHQVYFMHNPSAHHYILSHASSSAWIYR